MSRFVTWLSSIFGRTGEQAGFGQSLLDDLRFFTRFLRSRQVRVDWHSPSSAKRLADDAHGIIGRFGDRTIAVAHVGGRRWIVRERDWFGWPDARQYVLFILDDGRIWAASDFNTWPTNWHLDQSDTPNAGHRSRDGEGVS